MARKEDIDTRKLVRSLARRQAMISLSLLLLVAGSLALGRVLVANNEATAEIINLAGRQRMLSQRIAIDVQRYGSAGDATQRDTYRRLVRSAAADFSSAHQRLGAVARSFGPGTAIHSLYFGPPAEIDAETFRFTELARQAVIETASSAADSRQAADRVVRMADGEFLHALDDATVVFQRHAEDQVRLIRTLTEVAALLIAGLVLFGALGIFRPLIRRIRGDIAARDDAQRALRTSEERFKSFSESSSDWFWETDADHRLSWIHGHGSAATPFSISAVIGKTRWEAYADMEPEDAGKWRRHRAEVEAHRPFRDFESRIRFDDGTLHWVSVSGRPYFDDRGAFLGYRGTATDIDTRKESEALLKRLELAIEQSPVSIVISDAGGDVVYVNSHFTRITGYTAAEVLGKNPGVLLSGLTPSDLHADLWQTIGGGGTWRGELCNRKRNGELFWEYASISPVRDAYGTTTHYVAVKEDISARKRADRRDQNRNVVLEAIAHGARLPDLLQLIVRMTETEIDGGMCSIHSVSASGDRLLLAFGSSLPADLAAAIGGIEIDRGTGSPATASEPDWMALRAPAAEAGLDGCWSEPIRSSTGKLLGAVSVFRRAAAGPGDEVHEIVELTASLAGICLERAEAEQALRENIEIKRSIIAGALDAIITIDHHGNIIEFNQSAERIFGFRHDEVVGKPIADFIIPERYRDAHRRGIAAHGDRGFSTVIGRRLELPAIDASGREFPIELSIIHAEGLSVFAAFIRDLTEQRRTEEVLRRSQKMQALGQLTGGIAHDFNNLLAIIMGNLELLRRAVGNNEPALKRVDTALKSAWRGADLTRRLLVFSRQDGELAEPEIVDLNALIAGMIEMLERTLTQKIEILNIPGAELWPVSINSHEFEDCLLNLVINARDAMPNGGRLIIKTENRGLGSAANQVDPDIEAGDYVTLSINDNGSGIPSEIADRIFEPFFTTKERGKGTGLGLSMVYGTIKRAGGTIRVFSEAGKGSTFRIHLPKAARVVDGMPERTVQAMPVAGTETVLVVDDERQLVDIAAIHLAELGYRVLTASTGKEALAAVEARDDIDLVVSDVVMPGDIDGIELARRILAKGHRPKILLASGFAWYDEGKAYDADLRDVVREALSKPYSREELGVRIRQLLDRTVTPAT